MSIILRGAKGSALTYEELDGNLEQFYISSSLSSNGRVLSLFTSGGVDTVTFPPDDTLQSITDNGNTTTNSVLANSFIKSGSTSDDILLGDGTTTSLNIIASGSSSIFALTGSVYATTNDLEITGSLGISGSITNTDYIDLTGAEAPYNEGRLFYDQANGALAFYNEEADITLQIGQEFYKKVYNNSGNPIEDGTPVRISGSQGDVPYIWPALSENIYVSSYNAQENKIIGLTTHTIADNSTGYVTEAGIVRGINTTAFAAGDLLYLQTGSAEIRNTPPPFPYNTVPVGSVVRSQSNGFVEVRTQQPVTTENISGIVNIDLEVQSNESITIPKGTPVHINNTVAGTGPISLVNIAKANSASLMPATYVTEEEITSGSIGTALSIGYIPRIDTSGLNVGDTLYVSEEGGFTTTKPTGSCFIQNLGVVVQSDATDGSAFIYGSGRSNDLPNIQQGYIWVGDSDGVPAAVSTGSLSGSFLLNTTDTFTGDLTLTGKLALGDALSNSFIGTDSGGSNTTGIANVSIGYQALRLNTTGNWNTANGFNALYKNIGGEYNTANGNEAMYENTTGVDNTANGSYSLHKNKTSSYNTANGGYALYNTTSGNNTATGYQTLYANIGGIYNTADGAYALDSNTSGNYNTANGAVSLARNTTGSNNVASGYQSGRFLANKSTSATSLNNSVMLGWRTSPLADNETNQIVIGYDATGNGSNTVTLGNDSITTTYLKGDVTITGKDNTADGNYASVIGGTTHTGSGDYSFIGGGENNYTSGQRSAAIGGISGEVKASGSVVLGGSQNIIDVNGNQSSIIAGSNNSVGHPASSILAGENIATSRKFTTFAKSVFVTGSTGEGIADFGGLLQLSRRESTPSSPEEGMIIHSGSSGASVLYFYNGSTWKPLHS